MKNNLKIISLHPDFYYETTLDFCLHLGINPDQLAEWTGYTVSTARRLIKNNNPPRWLLPFLYACAGGVLCPDFYGFRLIDGRLTAPTLRGDLTASQISQYSWHLGVLSQYRDELARLTQPQKNRPQAAVLQFPGRTDIKP